MYIRGQSDPPPPPPPHPPPRPRCTCSHRIQAHQSELYLAGADTHSSRKTSRNAPPVASNARPGGGCEGGEHILVDRVRLGRRPIARIRTRSCMRAHAHTNARSDGFFPLTLFMQPTVVRHKSIKLLVSSWRSGLYDNTLNAQYTV